MESLCMCDDCGLIHEVDSLESVFPNIPWLLDRLDPGAEVPIAECTCGSFCYIFIPRLTTPSFSA